MHSLRERLAGLDATGVALVAALAALVLCVAAFLAGWATAGTREALNRADREHAPAPPAPLVLLGPAARLPAAPPKRRAAAAVRLPAPLPPGAGALPKLLSGTG